MPTYSVRIVLEAVDKASRVVAAVTTGVQKQLGVLGASSRGVVAGTKAVAELAGGWKNLSRELDAAGNRMALAGGAGVLAVGMMGRTAAGFEESMRNVNSLAQQGEDDFKALGESVRALTADPMVVDGPKRLADALYQIQSAGITDTALQLDVLEISAKGGAAGLSDVFTAADALTSIMNAYNVRTGPEAQRIMDMLFETVRQGKITFPELAQGIGPAAAAAAAAGVKFEEVGAAIGTMTARGNPAALSITALTRLMTTFLKPPEELASKIRELTGVEADMVIRTQGLQGALAVLEQATGNSGAALAQLGFEQRALRALFAITGAGAQDFADDLTALSTDAKAAQAALEQQAKSTAFQWKHAKAEWENTAVTFGNDVLPALTAVVQKISEMVRALGNMNPILRQVLLLLAGGGGLVLVVAGLTAKIVALVIQIALAIGKTRTYVAALLTEAKAANSAAAANTRLAASRASASKFAGGGTTLAHAGGKGVGGWTSVGSMAGGGAGAGAGALASLAAPLAAVAAALALFVGLYKAMVVPALKDLTDALKRQQDMTLEAAGRGFAIKGGSGQVYSPEQLQENLSGFDPKQANKLSQRSVTNLMEAYNQALESGAGDRAVKILEKVRTVYGDQAAMYVDVMSRASTHVVTQELKDRQEANQEMLRLEEEMAAQKAQYAQEASLRTIQANNAVLEAQHEVARLRGDTGAEATLHQQLVTGLMDEANALREVGKETEALAKESEALTLEMERQNEAREKALGLMDSQVAYYQSEVELLKAKGASEAEIRNAEMNVASAEFGRAGAIARDLRYVTDPEERLRGLAEMNRARASGLQIQNAPMLEAMEERKRQQERMTKKFGPYGNTAMGLQHNVTLDPQTMAALAQNPQAAERMGFFMSQWVRETYAGQAALGGAW